MDTFMGSMTAHQAVEWELFAGDNPSFEDLLLYQLAYIAQVFASVFIKKNDGSGFSINDFMPWKKEKQEGQQKGVVSSFKNILLMVGDEKAKKWANKDQEIPKVQGTDGNWYSYALEEFATRTKQPKRLISKRQN